MMPEPIITVIRPELTAEERAERQKKVEKCVSDFWKALKKEEHHGEEQKQSLGV